jgi:hypothetical protein
VSFDLAWYGRLEEGYTDVEAYEELCEGHDWVVLPYPGVLAFRRALLLKHPYLRDVVEPQEESDRYVLLSLPFPWIERVEDDLKLLALEHGLRGWDPQAESTIGADEGPERVMVDAGALIGAAFSILDGVDHADATKEELRDAVKRARMALAALVER